MAIIRCGERYSEKKEDEENSFINFDVDCGVGSIGAEQMEVPFGGLEEN